MFVYIITSKAYEVMFTVTYRETDRYELEFEISTLESQKLHPYRLAP